MRNFRRPRDRSPGRPSEAQEWRPRYAKDVLPDIRSHYGGYIKGKDRCGAVGLEQGNDCTQLAPGDKVYCYYHEKLQVGLTEPNSPYYPVWPLPRQGYVLLNVDSKGA